MIGGLSGLAAVIAGIACLVLVPIPLLVIVGVVMAADGWTLLVLALFWGWLGRTFWRWLTRPCVEPNHDAIHTPRGTRPEPEEGTISAVTPPQRKDGPASAPRTSLDEPEAPLKGLGVG